MNKVEFNIFTFWDTLLDEIAGLPDIHDKNKRARARFYRISVGWKNIILTLNKKIFDENHNKPLFGLKLIYSDREKFHGKKKELIDSFENLIRNWDDIFGDGYADHPEHFEDFVRIGSIEILEALVDFLHDEKEMRALIDKQKTAWRNRE